MTERERRTVYHLLINHYGADAQTDVAIEECAELIWALLKYRRADKESNGDAWQNIVSEIADVTVMLGQMQIVYGIPDGLVEVEIDRKLRRQMERMVGEAR